MTRKTKSKADGYASEEKPRKTINCQPGKANDDTGLNMTEFLTSPAFAALRVLSVVEKKSGLYEKLDMPRLAKTLVDQGKAVNQGDMTRLEGMLANQATALQALFSRLSEMAITSGYIPNFESFMKMALRAQSQCRATIETLAAIKNPPMVIAKQANVTSGPQQINNCSEPSPRAGENKSVQTKLSGGGNELLPDTGTPGFESQVNPSLETVGEVHRAKVRRGKG